MNEKERRIKYLDNLRNKSDELKKIMTNLINENISLRGKNRYYKWKIRKLNQQVLDLVKINKNFDSKDV